MAHHAHHHEGHLDWAAESARLDRWVEVERPVNEAIVEWLDVPAGAKVVDVGCGAGGMTVALARAVGAGGTVVAVDGEPAMISLTEDRVGEAATGATLRTLVADLDDPDWPELVRRAVDGAPQIVWASGVVHHLADEIAGVGRLAGLVPIGGILALAEGGLPMRWSSLDLGYDEPGLQARIMAAAQEWFPTMRDAIDGAVPRHVAWPEVLGALDLDVRTRSFLFDHPAPLTDAGRQYVVDHLVADIERLGPRLSQADNAALAALTGDTDPAAVLRRDDVFVLAARTVHTGTRLR